MSRINLRIVFMLIAAVLLWATASGGAPITAVDPVSGDMNIVEGGAGLTHLVFFATWCPPCLGELAALRDLEARWKPDGYRLVLIAIDQRETEARLARFIGDERPPGQVLFDRGGTLQSRFRAEGVPEHVLLDGSGQELFRASSLDDGVAAAIVQQLGSR